MVNNLEKLKTLVKNQLSDEICKNDFDMGYLQGRTSVRTMEDFSDVWNNIEITLYYGGLKNKTLASTKVTKRQRKGMMKAMIQKL